MTQTARAGTAVMIARMADQRATAGGRVWRNDETRSGATDVMSALSGEGRALLERTMARRAFQAGQTVIEKGDPVSGAFFVLTGALRVYALSPAGREAGLYLLRPGETCVLALNSLFADLRYPAFVRADSDCTVGIAPGHAFRALFEREPAIRDLTVRALSTLVFRLMDELEQVHSLTLEQRLAATLLSQADGGSVARRTQQRLADHLGATREAVARIMARLSTQGAIEAGRGAVRLVDFPALRRIAAAP